MKSLVSCLLTNSVFFIFILTTILFAPLPTYAVEEDSSNDIYTIPEPDQNTLTTEQKNNILITEFMPNPAKDTAEWVEIYNANSESVDLTNWIIDDVIEGGATPMEFSKSIDANSYTVIEISKTMLNNTGDDAVSLLDENSFPLHIVNYSKTVQASSIQKVENLGWYITRETTKGLNNLVKLETTTDSPSSKSSNSTNDVYETSEETLPVGAKNKITITEFYPYPDTNESEWVEIYNGNDQKVELKDWYIDDTLDSGGTPVLFSLEIDKKSYGVIKIDKSLLNNSDDVVFLLDESKNPIHKITYDKSIKGSSVQKLDKGWYITSENTKGKKNLVYLEPTVPITNSEKLNLSSLSTPVEEEGKVLGISNTNLKYRKIPVYNYANNNYLEFTNQNTGKVYVITEREMPSSFESLVKFFEKAFW